VRAKRTCSRFELCLCESTTFLEWENKQFSLEWGKGHFLGMRDRKGHHFLAMRERSSVPGNKGKIITSGKQGKDHHFLEWGKGHFLGVRDRLPLPWNED
jgi:hypothetical protein